MDYKKITRLFSPITVEGLLAVKRVSHERLVELFVDIDFSTQDVTKTEEELLIKLHILDKDSFYRALAGEANKFFLASRVSQNRAIQDQNNNASWQIVEHYYAAYYAVHYLLRLTGISLTNLDDKAINAINRSSLGKDWGVKIPTGLYRMKYDDLSGDLVLQKDLKKKTGGSHKDAWELWDDLLGKLKAQASTDMVEYASVDIDLGVHKSFVVKSNKKYNPPEIRGEINYQFKGGAWVFEDRSKEKIKSIQKIISKQIIAKPVKSATTEGLVASNEFIIEMAKAVFDNASVRYPKGICRSLSNKYYLYM